MISVFWVVGFIQPIGLNASGFPSKPLEKFGLFRNMLSMHAVTGIYWWDIKPKPHLDVLQIILCLDEMWNLKVMNNGSKVLNCLIEELKWPLESSTHTKAFPTKW